MLALSRKENEIIDIFIEDKIISFKIIRIRGKEVRLCIDSPNNAIIKRREISPIKNPNLT